MSRTRSIPDAEILAIVRRKLFAGGDRATSFGLIAQASGLSAPALVLRYGTQAQMLRAALLDGWANLQFLAESSEVDSSAKSVQEFLKSQAEAQDIPALLANSARDAQVLAAAAAWRGAIEARLAAHFGGGLKGRSAAGLVFAAWQGRLSWGAAGGKSFRLGEVIRSLA